MRASGFHRDWSLAVWHAPISERTEAAAAADLDFYREGRASQETVSPAPSDTLPPVLRGGGATGAVASLNPSGRPATPAKGRPQRSDPPQFMLRLPLAGLAACISHGARVVRPLWIVPRAAASAAVPVLRARARVATLVALAAPERALIRIAAGVLCRIGFVVALGFGLGAATYLLSQGRGWGG